MDQQDDEYYVESQHVSLDCDFWQSVDGCIETPILVTRQSMSRVERNLDFLQSRERV